jgi:hypothetical protein
MRVCQENGIEVAYTDPSEKFPHGQVKVDEETIAALAGLDPVLAQFHTRQEKDKLLTSYFPAMEYPFHSGITAERVYPDYETLKKTGRGSSRGTTKKRHNGCSCYQGVPCEKSTYPSLNVQQADPRVRACYLPGAHPQDVFVVADFSAIDLVCAAQTMFTLFGRSELRDQINAGLDPHTVMAGDFARADYPWWAEQVPEGDDYQTFKALKAKDHLSLCRRLDDGTYECHGVGTEKGCPVGFHKEVRDLSKRVGLGLLGGMGLARLCATVAKELHRKITEEKAGQLKKLWLRRYPTNGRYLQWVGKQKDGATGEWLYYVSPLGMRRARCSYTEAANGRALQTPAAEGMKIAMWLVTRECYLDETSPLFGWRPVINMHDELVGRGRWTSPGQGDAVARRWSQLMVKGQRMVCPDVTVKAEPLLTTRWVKEAKQVKDEEGRIIPWDSHASIARA